VRISQKTTSQKNIQYFVYGYDDFCNFASRKNSINNVEETFTYDNAAGCVKAAAKLGYGIWQYVPQIYLDLIPKW